MRWFRADLRRCTLDNTQRYLVPRLTACNLDRPIRRKMLVELVTVVDFAPRLSVRTKILLRVTA